MNDLQSLHAALAQDDPSQDVADHSRHRLQNRIAGGPGPRRQTRWLAAGTGVTVMAAAAAVAISVLPAGSPLGNNNPPASTDKAAPTKTVTAQQVFLAAATAAERAPAAGSGAYWHVNVTITRSDGRVKPEDVWDYWIGQDGRVWFSGLKTNGKAKPSQPEPKPYAFDLFGVGLTVVQLRALPTDPEALKTWISDAIRNGDARSSAGPLRDTPELLAQAQFDSLIMLVSVLPVTPEVRAAAFRALATYPDVQSLGEVPGGQGQRLPDGGQFVVDPKTGHVNGASSFVITSGAVYSVSDGTAKLTTEWADTLP